MTDNFSIKLVSTTRTEQDFIDLLVDTITEGETEELRSMLMGNEGLMAYTARVSSPNQSNTNYAGLLGYCMRKNHWSVFEMCDMTVEIETSRGISPQILRHKSFSFQEFSQRYAVVDQSGIMIYVARRQDNKNRQNSVDDLSDEIKGEWEDRQLRVWKYCFENYMWALDNEIAKECARFVLPLGTRTKMYMKGSIRSWIHYIDLRSGNGTQKEHMDIANAIKEVFCKKYPVIAEAKGWSDAK